VLGVDHWNQTLSVHIEDSTSWTCLLVAFGLMHDDVPVVGAAHWPVHGVVACYRRSLALHFMSYVSFSFMMTSMVPSMDCLWGHAVAGNALSYFIHIIRAAHGRRFLLRLEALYIIALQLGCACIMQVPGTSGSALGYVLCIFCRQNVWWQSIGQVACCQGIDPACT
jgi:hypothetical protein